MVPKLVILPGWMNTSEQWQQILPFFEKFTPIVLDLPGFGKIEKQSDDWGVPEYANYVTQQVTPEPPSSVILLGHSFGGRVAAYLASHNPSWLKALILYGAPCVYRPTVLTTIISKLAQIAKKLGLPASLSPNKELREADSRGMGKVYRKTVTFDQTTTLQSILVRTLILHGEQDQEASVINAEETASLIPHATLDIIPDEGHYIHLTQPQLFYGKVTKFIETL